MGNDTQDNDHRLVNGHCDVVLLVYATIMTDRVGGVVFLSNLMRGSASQYRLYPANQGGGDLPQSLHSPHL